MPDVRPHKAYLGDGVYADLDESGAVVLTTEDGIRTTNRIVLEPEVLATLDVWRYGRTEFGTQALRDADDAGEEE